ncbi:hypothetical protein BGW41_003581 [Actinomortierella wolfii]|nr:hypothetical protein BGW41_003581 [Actinomortierella wolfii]
MEELLQWRPGGDDYNVSNTPLHPRSYGQSKEPELKVIVCHDMAGGYVEDAATQGNNYSTIYSIQSWRYIDTFIYFSHARVTIPPPCWTNAAHRNGVKCLGTFITEWLPGIVETDQLVSGPGAALSTETVGEDDDDKGGEDKVEDGDGNGKAKKNRPRRTAGEKSAQPDKVDRRWFSKVFADKLVDIAAYYKFDGWLINIESILRGGNAQAKQMVAFLSYLRQQIHARIPGGELIWYDSVIYSTGELSWQDRLSPENYHFFEQSDGGTFGGGGFYTYRALDVIKREGTSAALFAPGYLYQQLGAEDFLVHDRLFWTGFNGAGVHFEALNKVPTVPPPPEPPKKAGGENSTKPSDSPCSTASHTEDYRPVAMFVEARPSGSKTWFYTDFDRGFGNKIFIDGKQVRGKQWSNLSRQSLPPNMANEVYILRQDSLRDDISRSSGPRLGLDVCNTIRWILSPDDAYYGGTSILIEQVGCLEDKPTPAVVGGFTTVAIPLYDTHISLGESPAWSVELVFKRLQPGVELVLYMGINRSYADDIDIVKFRKDVQWNTDSQMAPLLIAQGVQNSTGPANATSLIALDIGKAGNGVQTTKNLEHGWHKVVVNLTGMLEQAELFRHGSTLAQLGVTVTFPTTSLAQGVSARPLALLGSLAVLPLHTPSKCALFALRASSTNIKVVMQPSPKPSFECSEQTTEAEANGQAYLRVWSTLDWDIGYAAEPQNRQSNGDDTVAEVSPTEYSHFNVYLSYEPGINGKRAYSDEPIYVGTAFTTKYRITGATVAVSPPNPGPPQLLSVGSSSSASSMFRLVAWVQGVRRHGQLDPREEWISRELS